MQARESTKPTSRPAPLVPRLRAAFIDWFVLPMTALILTVASSACLFLYFAYLIPDYVSGNPQGTLAWLIGGVMAIHGSLTLVVTLRPTVWPAGRTGQSAAMAWAGITLVDHTSGSPVGVPRSFARALPKLAATFVIPLAVLSLYGVSAFDLSWLVIAMAALDVAAVLLTEERLTLMDRILHTRVVLT
jgi:hypothetical protein